MKEKLAELSSILYLGSTLSEKAVANSYSYSTLKHAVIGLMRATTQDLAPNRKIHSCCICPGFTKTKMLLEHIRDTNILKEITKINSHNRLIEPKEISEFLYFCSQTPVINGAILHANLGQIER